MPEDPKNKPTGEIVSHDFGKAMDRAAKKSLSKELKKAGTRISHKPTSSSAHFVNALAEGDEKQKDKLLRLLNFIGTELTKRGDPQKGTRKRRTGKELEEESGRPRLYGRDFCPLLEEKVLAGALGHHKHNPESGRRIYGGAPQATSKSGAFPEGLLSLLGYHETTRAGKARDIREAMLLMEEVVGAKLEGLVALKQGDSWLRVSEAIAKEADLPTIGREARVFLFVPEDYGDRLPTIYNAYSERRAKEQALPYVPQITKDRALHERNDLERPTKTPIVEVEATAKVRTLDEVTPLHRRLAGARNGRDLTQKEVGELFGVSAQTIKLWETFERDELGKTTKGRPIPKQIAPLLERWLRERIAPTKEELDSLTKRREGRRKADRES
jgi:DNA-binding XRE family transcriptional regulator